MNEKELLNDWLLNLYSSLKDLNKEIKELESNLEYHKQLTDLQLSRINSWLEEEDLEQDLREEFEFSKEVVSQMPKDDKRKLDQLITQRKTVLFMIKKVVEELENND